MFSMKEFGQRVSNLRKVRNLTQDELAYRVNVNKGHISRIERGTVACSLELLIGNYITNKRKDKAKIHFLATNTAFQFILQ